MAVSSEILSSQGQTIFNGLPKLPASKNDFIVFVNNVLTDTALYERTGDNQITFNDGLNENDKVRVLVPFEQPTSCSGNIIYPGSPTLQELYTKVRSEMKIDRVGRIWSNEDIKDAINNAILTLQKATNFGWQENDSCQNIQTISGQTEYDISTDTQGIELVEYEGTPLQSTTKEKVLELNQTLPSGTPRYYYLWNGKIGFSPIPSVSNKNIDINYQKFLVPLSDDTDVLPFKNDFTLAIVLYASYMLFTQTSDSKNIQRANVKKARYQEELNTIRLAYLIPDRGQVEYKTTYRSRSFKHLR